MGLKLRNIAAWMFSTLLIVLGFARRAKNRALRGQYILSIYFHSPSKQLFEFCIKWLTANGFRILSQEDILNISQNKTLFPIGGVIITVDDGWESNEHNIVATAEKYKVPVAIFITTEAIESGNFWWPIVQKAHDLKLLEYTVEQLKTIPNEERELIVSDIKEKVALENRAAMTIEQIKRIALSELITIGSHTVSHPILPNCTYDKSFEELAESKRILEKWINKSIDIFAYPNGDYGDREIKLLTDLGYSLAYTTVAEYLTPDHLQKKYQLPRFEVFEGISEPEAICRMLGVWQNIINKR